MPDKPRSLSENSVVGQRASVFSPDKDGEAGDVCFIVDAAGCRQAENKPLEARSSFPTGSQWAGLCRFTGSLNGTLLGSLKDALYDIILSSLRKQGQ